ncbi:MAG: hypothetical protein NUW23_02505 [Firmicutes bacterium]|nr:hypothetical protein [Bacillota bacterium]
MKRLDVEYVNRSMVCNPSGPHDFFDHVEGLLPRPVRESFREAECAEDQRDVINVEIIPHLQRIAPDGCVFGRNPFYTDCSDWGFWQILMPLPDIQVRSFGIARIGTFGRWFDPVYSATITLPNCQIERLCCHTHLKMEAARRCGAKRLRARLARFRRQAKQDLRRRDCRERRAPK